MGWYPDFETPEYQARLKQKIEDEVRSWNEYCEERAELYYDVDRGNENISSPRKRGVLNNGA